MITVSTISETLMFWDCTVSRLTTISAIYKLYHNVWHCAYGMSHSNIYTHIPNLGAVLSSGVMLIRVRSHIHCCLHYSLQEWTGLELPQYGQGSGLLAWMECCCVSDSLRSTMLSHLCVDRRQPDHVNMFSKGLLVALAQTLPWCSLSEWQRLLGALGELLASGLLHTPYSLEYVDYLPLLDLRCFSSQLRLSVLLLRALQFLCGSSCDGWLPAQGWAHVGRLYAYAIRESLEVLRTKLALSSSSVSAADPTSGSPNPPKNKNRTQSGELQPWKEASPEKSSSSLYPKSPAVVHSAEGVVGDLSAEVLFVLGQLFCHVQHVQV